MPLTEFSNCDVAWHASNLKVVLTKEFPNARSFVSRLLFGDQSWAWELIGPLDMSRCHSCARLRRLCERQRLRHRSVECRFGSSAQPPKHLPPRCWPAAPGLRRQGQIPGGPSAGPRARWLHAVRARQCGQITSSFLRVFVLQQVLDNFIGPEGKASCTILMIWPSV